MFFARTSTFPLLLLFYTTQLLSKLPEDKKLKRHVFQKSTQMQAMFFPALSRPFDFPHLRLFPPEVIPGRVKRELRSSNSLGDYDMCVSVCVRVAKFHKNTSMFPSTTCSFTALLIPCVQMFCSSVYGLLVFDTLNCHAGGNIAR